MLGIIIHTLLDIISRKFGTCARFHYAIFLEVEEVCEKTACKRKSTGGGDAPDGTPAEEAPEKKLKTDAEVAKGDATEAKPEKEEVTA